MTWRCTASIIANYIATRYRNVQQRVGTRPLGRAHPTTTREGQMKPLLLGGAWVDRDRSISVVDPADGRHIADVAVATPEDVARAVTIASATWRRPLPAAQRHDILDAVADRLTDEIEI